MRKSLSLAGLVAGALLASPALAAPISDGVARAATETINDDGADGDKKMSDERLEKLQEELEKALGEFLEWDDSQKRFRMREEMARTLPVPPPMIEGFINRMLDEKDGQPVFKSRDQFKQALPLLKRFLEQGEQQIERIPNLDPEEKEKLLKRARRFKSLFEEPKAAPKKPARRLERLKKLAKPNLPTLRPNKALLERIERLEKRVRELEGELSKRRSQPRNPLKRGLPGLPAVPEALGTAKDFAGALSRLNKIMTKEDWQMFLRNGAQLGKAIKPQDLQNQKELMRKLQSSLEPGDLPRLMEILSEFLETDEGQNLEARAEKIIAALEKFMASEQGKRLEERLKNLGKSKAPERFGRLFGKRGAPKEKRLY